MLRPIPAQAVVSQSLQYLPLSSSLLSPSPAVTHPVHGLTDYVSGSMDVLYYGYLLIGRPAQSLSGDFDTGSADLWVCLLLRVFCVLSSLVA